MIRSPAAVRRRGQTSTETILLVVLIAIAALAIVTTFGYKVQRLWKKDVIALDTGQPPVGGGPLSLGNAVAPVTGPVVARNFPAGGEVTSEERSWDAAVDLLQSSAIGREALAYAHAHNVPVRLVPTIGSQYNPPNGPIDLDTSVSPEDMALTFVHEVNHARGQIQGTHPNIATAPQNVYVTGMIQEEVVGTVASIEAKMELTAAGKNVTAVFPLEPQYMAAYNAAVAAARAANPAATPAQLQAAGRAAGYQAVLTGFNNGTVVAGNTNPPLTYPQYYTNAWNAAHPGGAGS